MTDDMPIFPSKKQLVVLNAADDLQITDYFTAIRHIVRPKKVLFASKMSKGRVCIYLGITFLVDEDVSKYSAHNY